MARRVVDNDVLAGFGMPLSRSTPVTEVARRIVDQLTSGVLEPGTRLPSERVLAERLNVTRSTVRQALAALDLLGIIETRHGAGNYVRNSSSQLLPQAIEWGLLLEQPGTKDLVEARRHVEIVHAGLAAERTTPESLAVLQSAFDRMRQNSADPSAFVDADVDFHFQIASMTGNAVLAGVLGSIRSLLQVWIKRAASTEHDVDVTLHEHQAILDAIVVGDAHAARIAMDRHLGAAEERLTRSLERTGDVDSTT